MFTNTDSLLPRDDVVKFFEDAKTLLELRQDNNVEFWQNMDATALEIWLREDHPDKADTLNSRICLSALRELLSRHLAKMRCAAEWVHRIFEVSISELKSHPDYFILFSELCDDHPELLRDAYIHYGLAQAVQTLMARWYLQPKAEPLAGAKRALPHTFVKASDNEALARLLSRRWTSGDRFYADRDLLRPVVGDACTERKVLIFTRLKESENDSLSLAFDRARTVIEQGPRTSRLTETFADGLLRLPLTSSAGYLEHVRSRVAVLYLFDDRALFVEYPWNRSGTGHQRLAHAYSIGDKALPVQGTDYPVEQYDEVDTLFGWQQVYVPELPEWAAKALAGPSVHVPTSVRANS
ncbi:hypothetical protein B0G81_2394 [Paraburkholderia sp. BL6665CI2N2]|uniref:hypothetical protein n=1 Tax=Paraburkholderia sp. BL6665CI2N2 TaxID=1938806 RepID=UPI001064BBDD|nr:hypothetical protein [Paraburkholderia sp. BL6665CI2N2]TDY22108.1 hypothetical protein B0G81_2394 [Paraburkholderia sp. BL6665CI2N2]